MINSSTELENLHVSPPDAKPVLYAGAVEKAQIFIYNEDCLQALKAMADKQFDLAIVDPPYGIGAENHAGNKENGWTQWAKKDWDKAIPTAEYWEELFRVSKNQKALKEGKIHPTQKPTDLYKWLLEKYAKPGDKILDTHLGSMSIAIACHDYGFDLTGCELDSEYFANGIQRVKNHIAQLQLF